MPDDVHAESWSQIWQIAGGFGALLMGALLTALGFRSRRSDEDGRPATQLDLAKLRAEIRADQEADRRKMYETVNNENVGVKSNLRLLEDRVAWLEFSAGKSHRSKPVPRDD